MLGGGGHTAQMVRLVKLLGDRYRYSYLVAHEDGLSLTKIPYRGEVHRVHKLRNYGEPLIATIFRALRATLESLLVAIRARPDAVVSAGPGLAIPIMFFCKILGAKTIFIEDWSRVATRSLSGLVAYRMSDLFFVQWPELKRAYPKAVYAGRLA